MADGDGITAGDGYETESPVARSTSIKSEANDDRDHQQLTASQAPQTLDNFDMEDVKPSEQLSPTSPTQPLTPIIEVPTPASSFTTMQDGLGRTELGLEHAQSPSSNVVPEPVLLQDPSSQTPSGRHGVQDRAASTQSPISIRREGESTPSATGEQLLSVKPATIGNVVGDIQLSTGVHPFATNAGEHATPIAAQMEDGVQTAIDGDEVSLGIVPYQTYQTCN